MPFIFSPVIPILEWADRPDPASYVNKPIFVTDFGIGGSYWTSDGAGWRLSAPARLFQGNNVFTTSGTTEEVASSILIPAGTFSINSTIRTYATVTKSGAVDTPNFRVRMGVTGTTADVILNGGVTFTATTLSYGSIGFFQRINQTDVRRTGSSGTGNGVGQNASSSAAQVASKTVADMDSVDTFFTFTLQGGATDTLTLSNYLVEMF